MSLIERMKEVGGVKRRYEISSEAQTSTESGGISSTPSETLPENTETPSPAEAAREASESPPLKKRKQQAPVQNSSVEHWGKALSKTARHRSDRTFTTPSHHQLTGNGPVTDPKVMAKLLEIGEFSFEQMKSIVHRLNTKKQHQIVELGMYFFWRFFVGYTDPINGSLQNEPHSPDRYYRKIMMCACLFLAAKSRDSLIRLSDLVAIVFNIDPLSEETLKRREQIAKAELYLIVVMRFEFNRRLPSTEFISELESLTKLNAIELLGQRAEGFPWVLSFYRFFFNLSRHPICVKYTPTELAVGIIKIGVSWVPDPWRRMDGSLIEADVVKWEERLLSKHKGIRITEVVTELLSYLPRVKMSQEDFIQACQQQKNACYERARSLTSGSSPPPATPTFGSRFS